MELMILNAPSKSLKFSFKRASDTSVIVPVYSTSPTTSKATDGVVVLTPTLPAESTVNFPFTSKIPAGVVVPIPTLPLDATLIRFTRVVPVGVRYRTMTTPEPPLPLAAPSLYPPNPPPPVFAAPLIDPLVPPPPVAVPVPVAPPPARVIDVPVIELAVPAPPLDPPLPLVPEPLAQPPPPP